MKQYLNMLKKITILCGMMLLLTYVSNVQDAYAATNTGNERNDIIAHAVGEDGTAEDRSATFYSKYNTWYWNFVNIEGNDPNSWSSMKSEVAHGAWCYMFIGWAADQAKCNIVVDKSSKGIYIDGRVARAIEDYNQYNTSEKYPNWFGNNNRLFTATTTKAVVDVAEKGDIVFAKNGGFNHVLLVASKSGSSITTAEGNIIESDGVRRVVTRTMNSSSNTEWNSITLRAVGKPMYRATATFYTDGVKLNSMPSDGTLWFYQSKSEGNYYKYKFYDDLKEYNGTSTKLPTASNLGTKSGFEFKGWYDNSSYSGSPVTEVPTSVKNNVTYYAKWESNEFNVTLYVNGGTLAPGANITKYKYGPAVYLPTSAQIARHEHTFKGWYENSYFSGSPVDRIPEYSTGDRAYYAKWELNSYDVKLYPNGGTIHSGNVTKYTYGTGAKLPTASQITRVGHDFLGWYDNSSFSGDSVSEITATDTGNKAYWARWKAKVYSVTLHPNGGTIAAGKNVTQYTYGVGAKLPAGSSVRKDASQFVGWYDNPSFSGTPVTNITTTDLGNKEYWAKWITYTLQIEDDLLNVYGSNDDENVFKAEILAFKVVTEDTSMVLSTVTETSNVASEKIIAPQYINTNTDITMNMPNNVLYEVVREKKDMKAYLHIIVQATDTDGVNYNIYINDDFMLKYVTSFREW